MKSASTENRLTVELFDQAIRAQLEINSLAQRWRAADSAHDVEFLTLLERELRRFAALKDFLEALNLPPPDIITHPGAMRKIVPHAFMPPRCFQHCWRS